MNRPSGCASRRGSRGVARSPRGFILAEAVVAIVLVGGLLLVLMRWQQTDALQQQARTQVQYSQKLLAMVEQYRREYLRFPTDLSALVTDQVWAHAQPQPRGVNWSWNLVNQDAVTLTGQLDSAARAQWLAAQLPAAHAVGKQVRVQIEAPVVVPEVDTDAFLHRHVVAGKPELNRLQSDLSMEGHDLLDVGRLTATQLSADRADVDQLETANLSVSERLRIGATEWRSTAQGLQVTATLLALQGSLAVADDIQLSGGDVRGVGRLQAADIVSQNLTTVDFDTETLVAEQLVTDSLQITGNLALAEAHIGSLESDTVMTGYLSTQTLDAITARIDNVEAGMVYADDLSAQGHTLAENYQRLLSIQSLWDECVDVGGCR